MSRDLTHRPKASQEALSTTALTLHASEPQLSHLWKGKCKHLPYGVFVQLDSKSICPMPGSGKVARTPRCPDPSLPHVAPQTSEPRPAALVTAASEASSTEEHFVGSGPGTGITPVCHHTLWGSLQSGASNLTSRHYTEDLVALAPAISLGSHGHRLCMKFSLAAQQDLPQFLPALPFRLSSCKEQLGELAIKAPSLCPWEHPSGRPACPPPHPEALALGPHT